MLFSTIWWQPVNLAALAAFADREPLALLNAVIDDLTDSTFMRLRLGLALFKVRLAFGIGLIEVTRIFDADPFFFFLVVAALFVEPRVELFFVLLFLSDNILTPIIGGISRVGDEFFDIPWFEFSSLTTLRLSFCESGSIDGYQTS